MFFSTRLLTALLVACAAASPVASPDSGSTTLLPRNGKTLIGYRTVSEDEEKIPPGSIASGQYSLGKSLAHAAGELASLQPGVAYFCYVLADTAASAAANKVHLPVPAPALDWTEANAVKAIKAIPAANS